MIAFAVLLEAGEEQKRESDRCDELPLKANALCMAGGDRRIVTRSRHHLCKHHMKDFDHNKQAAQGGSPQPTPATSHIEAAAVLSEQQHGGHRE